MNDGIPFKDLADELGINTFHLAKLRDEKLKEGEHYTHLGRKYFTAEGADKLRLAMEVPLAVPTRARGRVIKPARNPRFVYVELENNKGVVVPVNIPRRLYGRLIGKPINVDVIKDAQGGVSYRHEDLAS